MERLRPWLVWWATVIATGYFSFLYLHGARAVGALIGVAIGIIGFSWVLYNLMQRRPRITWVGCESRPTTMSGQSGHIAYIIIANDPKVGVEPIHAVGVSLKYTDEETGTVLYNGILGRWSHLARVTDPVEASAHRRVTIEGDGQPYRIEVALLIAGSSEMYVIDDMQTFRGLDRGLGVGPTVVNVRIQGRTTGRHIDQTRRFRLTGQHHRIDIEPL
jgi:hypothetical protein